MSDIDNHDFDIAIRAPDSPSGSVFGIIGRVDDRLKVDVGESGPLITIPGLVALTSRIREYDRDTHTSASTPKTLVSFTVPVDEVLELFHWHAAAEGASYLVSFQLDGVEFDAIRAVSANDAGRIEVEYTAAPVQAVAGEVVSIELLEVANNKEIIVGFNGIVFDA
jgi:hypothetical protein